MSYENFLSHRIKCDYPGCGRTDDDWWNDQWLTLALYGEQGRVPCVRHFCIDHLDTARKAVPAGSYRLPDETPDGWHTWGEGYMYPLYEPCIPFVMKVLRDAEPDDPLPDKLVTRCAVALFRADTNWARDNPSEKEVLELWGSNPPYIRERFKEKARTVLRETLADDARR